jgi:Xaa-Pro aminopeptidase
MKRFSPLDSSLFIQNRKDFVAQLKPNSIAIFHSGDQFMKSADATHAFFQNPDLYYLTGIDQEDTILVLFPDAPNEAWKEVLFVKETSELIKVWEGYKYTKEQATSISGIQHIQWNKGFKNQFDMMMHYAAHVYVNLNEHDRAHFDGDYKDLRFLNEIKTQFPLHQFERSAPIMGMLRTAKKQQEIDMIQAASNITIEAFKSILKDMKKFKYEFEVEAEYTYIFNRNKAIHAYNPIIAGGANACVLHYNDNDKELRNGDLLLMDVGSSFANYASDMTRTIPVSGRFSDRQKTIYNACLNVFKECKKLFSTQISLLDYNNECKKLMEMELVQVGLLDATAVQNQDPMNPLYRKYFPHGVAHFLGLDVHDVGNHYSLIPNNAVLTCEPGIYIQEEGLGIRIENDIVVKSDGIHIDLFKDCPIEVSEIEDLMN